MSAAIKPILAILLLFAVGSLAFGQAGSTGGTIGNTNKSVSGEEGAAGPDAAARPHPKSERPLEKRNRTNVPPPGGSATERSLCEAVVGNWTFSNRIGVVFKAGGDLSATNGDVGKWTCKSGMVTARWRKWTDHYVVSSDRAHMSGNSGLLNFALSATKN
jgi:hypothetical protein